MSWDGSERRKRGRPRIAACQKRVVKMQIRVTEQLADRLYVIALRRRTDVSSITREFFERLAASEFLTDEIHSSTLTH
jgi:hypothetical protein